MTKNKKLRGYEYTKHAFIVVLTRWMQMVVATYVSHLWTVFQPLLFGLIGAEVSLSLIQLATVGLGLAVLGIGLVLRLITSFFIVMGLGLSLRERLFVAIAWLPKATVQVSSCLRLLHEASSTSVE